MGSEKSATQAGNDDAWGVGNENVGVEIRIGVFVDSGVMDAIIEGSFIGSIENSLTPQAKVKVIVLTKKNNSLKSFIFPFLQIIGNPIVKIFPNRFSYFYTNIT
jgi:hypothetical protein